MGNEVSKQHVQGCGEAFYHDTQPKVQHLSQKCRDAESPCADVSRVTPEGNPVDQAEPAMGGTLGLVVQGRS